MVQVVASNVVAQNMSQVGVAPSLSSDGTRVTVQTVGGVVDAAVLNDLPRMIQPIQVVVVLVVVD